MTQLSNRKALHFLNYICVWVQQNVRNCDCRHELGHEGALGVQDTYTVVSAVSLYLLCGGEFNVKKQLLFFFSAL